MGLCPKLDNLGTATFEIFPQPLEVPCASQGGYLLVQLLTLEIDLDPVNEQSLSGFLVLAEVHLNSW